MVSRERPRILVLGYGGGTAAAIMRAVRPGCHVTGVDPDPYAWETSRQWGYAADREIHGDARDALLIMSERREKFDVVVEDIFAGYEKPDWVAADGFRLVRDVLDPRGLVASNWVYVSEAQRARRAILAAFPQAVQVTTDGLSNRVFIAGPSGVSTSDVEAALDSHAGFADFAAASRVFPTRRTR